MKGFLVICGEKIPVDEVNEYPDYTDFRIDFPIGKPFSIINMKSGEKLTHEEVVDRLKTKTLQKDEWILEVV